MIKRILLHLSVQLGVVFTSGVMGFIPVLLFVLGLGGIAVAVVPDITFGLLDGIICPKGTLEYYWKYEQFNTYDLCIDCVDPDGQRTDVKFPSILLIISVFLLLVLATVVIPTLLLLVIAAFLVTHKVISKWEVFHNVPLNDTAMI